MNELDELLNKALTILYRKGFPINEKIEISVDSKLPFMGYTTKISGQTKIIISHWAQKSDMLMGLIIHELSHVYRTQTLHPSHNFDLLNRVLTAVFRDLPITPQHEQILHKLLNHLQDIYADDISFKAYIGKSLPQNYLVDFFLDWVRVPDPNKQSGLESWDNAEAILSTAFATANASRHIKSGGVLKKPKIIDFLHHLSPEQIIFFNYFHHFMVDLPDPVSDSDFTHLLTEYLHQFLRLIHTFTEL